MEMSEIVSWFKNYLETTPQDILDKEWAEVKAKAAGVGPTVAEYLSWNNDSEAIWLPPLEPLEVEPAKFEHYYQPRNSEVFF